MFIQLVKVAHEHAVEGDQDGRKMIKWNTDLENLNMCQLCHEI